MTLNSVLIDGLNKGMRGPELYPIAVQHGYRWKYKSFKNYLGCLRAALADKIANTAESNKCGELETSILKIINKKKILKINDVADQYEVAPKTILAAITKLQHNGYEISVDDVHILLDGNVVSPARTTEPIATDDVIFAVASDLHFGSKHCQITALNEFCEECRKRGVKHILVPGDVVCGYNVYAGQMQDQYAISSEGQLNSLLANLPRGFEWYVLGGNHDYSFVAKAGGYNIINAAANMRSDIHYIGFDVANVPLLHGVDATLIHPSGGVPYSHCLSEDTEILTKRGWLSYKDMSLNEEVATLSPVTGKLEYEHPEELFIENFEGEMFHFTGLDIDHLVTGHHDLWTRTFDGRNAGDWMKIKASAVTDSYRRQKYQFRADIDSWDGEELEYIEIPFKNWSGAKNLGKIPMDSFLGFLGWFISEGNTEAGKRIRITQKDEGDTNKIKRLCENIGLTPVVYTEEREDGNHINRVFSYSGSLVRWVDEHCGRGAANKKVPAFIRNLSSRQINIFLKTLFQGDGSKHITHNFGFSTYSTKSKQLADDVQELLLKVGYPSTVIPHDKGMYSVSVREKFKKPYLLNKPEIVNYKGKIWCVKTSNGIIYARRNGKAIWTGNSYRLQKNIEQVAYTELYKMAYHAGTAPTVRFVFSGHLHIQIQGMFGSIFGAQCGCFEGQTNYLKRKGLFPHIGAYIIEASLNKTGILKNFDAKFYMYDEIIDDYKSYSHTLTSNKKEYIIDPIL